MAEPLKVDAPIYGIEGEKHLMNFSLGWKDSEWGDEGRKKRNRIARELRQLGYEVKVESPSFSDLARDSSYLLTAHWPGSTKPPMGVPTDYQHKEST